MRDVLKGARALHPAPQKQARPLAFDVLEMVITWLERAIDLASQRQDRPTLLRATRDRALVLLGFWRGFRADELSRLRVEHIEVRTGEGLRCYLPRSKGERTSLGRHFDCPALPKLCPVAAYTAWIDAAGLTEGAVFRRLDRNGVLGSKGLNPGSLIPLLRRVLRSAGVADADQFSSHSLRRGFAGWARSAGWDVKDLMAYVGWQDVKSAMRYLEGDTESLKTRFEASLLGASAPNVTEPPAATVVELRMIVNSHDGSARAARRVTDLILKTCLERYAVRQADKSIGRYEVALPANKRDELDEIVYALLEEAYRIADDNGCSMELSVFDRGRGWHWN